MYLQTNLFLNLKISVRVSQSEGRFAHYRVWKSTTTPWGSDQSQYSGRESRKTPLTPRNAIKYMEVYCIATSASFGSFTRGGWWKYNESAALGIGFILIIFSFCPSIFSPFSFSFFPFFLFLTDLQTLISEASASCPLRRNHPHNNDPGEQRKTQLASTQTSPNDGARLRNRRTGKSFCEGRKNKPPQRPTKGLVFF